jgi:hypothetical protein
LYSFTTNLWVCPARKATTPFSSQSFSYSMRFAVGML